MNLTPEEAAKRLKVQLGTLYHWKLRGKGPKWFKAGRLLRYRLVDIEAFEQQRGAAA